MGQFALQAVQRVVRMGHGDELDVGQLVAELVGEDQAADGEVGLAFVERFLDARQHFLAQQHAAAAALRHEGGEGVDHLAGRIGGIHHQAHFGFPALFHVVRQLFQLAGLLDQLPRAAQQQGAGVGEHRLAPVDAQQRHAELLLHAGDRVADRGLRAVQGFGGLGEAAVVDHRLQGAPLFEGHAGGFHRANLRKGLARLMLQDTSADPMVCSGFFGFFIGSLRNILCPSITRMTRWRQCRCPRFW
ncbi:hypothetical protein D3C78_924230 [compost metagenome]